jgi:hypothetical protein
MSNRARSLWRSPHLLMDADRRALLLGVMPPPVDVWQASVRARWSDGGLTALTPERQAELHQVHVAERLAGSGWISCGGRSQARSRI